MHRHVPPPIEQRSNFLIKICNDFFMPSYLKIEKGDIVEWMVSEESVEQN